MMAMAVKVVMRMCNVIYDDDENGNGRDSDHDGEVAGKRIDVINVLKIMGMAVRTSTEIITTLMTIITTLIPDFLVFCLGAPIVG